MNRPVTYGHISEARVASQSVGRGSHDRRNRLPGKETVTALWRHMLHMYVAALRRPPILLRCAPLRNGVAAQIFGRRTHQRIP
jgi:hypothetical protein